MLVGRARSINSLTCSSLLLRPKPNGLSTFEQVLTPLSLRKESSNCGTPRIAVPFGLLLISVFCCPQT